jgi:hypothetical protein
MVEEAVAMVVVVVVVAAISVGLPGIALRGIVLPAIASHKTKERTLRGTKVISGTKSISGTIDISLLEIPFGMITHTTGMIIRTTVIMTTMPATIPMDNPHQPK